MYSQWEFFYIFSLAMTLTLEQCLPKFNGLYSTLGHNFLQIFRKIPPKLRALSCGQLLGTNIHTRKRSNILRKNFFRSNKWPQASNFEKKHAYMPIYLIKNMVKVIQNDQARYINLKALAIDTNFIILAIDTYKL